MPGKPENRESKAGMHKAKGGAGSGSVSSIEVGSKGAGGIRFKLQGGILDHSKVKETIGRK